LTATGRRLLELAFVTAALALIAASSHVTAIATIAAIPLVLILPGVALVIVVDPEKELLSGAERYFWAGVASVGITVIGGLILNATTSLDRPSWIVILAGITGVALVVGWIRSDVRLPHSDAAQDPTGIRRSGLYPRWIFAGVGIVVLGFVVIGNAHQRSSISSNTHKTAATTTTTPTTSKTVAVTAQCEAIDATSTIGFVANKAGNGTYKVLALGTSTSDSSTTLNNVVVTWNVTYADRSTGAPTSTLVHGSSLAPGASAPWGEQATTSDGQVPPTGVEITQISGTKEVNGVPTSNTQCPTAKATSSIGTAISRGENGDYHDVALGVVTNRSSTPLCDVVVTWTVSYADRTTGPPTTTLVLGANIPRGGSAFWGDQAATNDGQVRPTGVEITNISGVPEGPACTS
jgi:hypothetical protein